MTKRTDASFQTIAYDKIREDIVYCAITPGQKLSASVLETQLGIGRTPVREALVRLGQQGIVYTVPQSGTYVSKIDMREAENARFMREHLETSIAMECAALISSQQCNILEGLIKIQREAAAKKDAYAFFRSDNLFHEELFRIAGRHDIWRWIADNSTNLERFRWLRTQVIDLNWDTIISQHEQLFSAITNGDPEEARFLTSMHLHLMITERDAVTSAYPQYFSESTTA